MYEDQKQAVFAVVVPIALAPAGRLSVGGLRCAYAGYGPLAFGFEETVMALESRRLLVPGGLVEFGRRQTGYELTVAGEAMADFMLGRHPEATVRTAARAILQQAHSEGMVEHGFTGGHVGPARAAMIFESLLYDRYLAPPTLSFGQSATRMAIITQRGITVLDRSAPRIF